MDLGKYIKNLSLEAVSERGQAALRHFLFDGWIREFTATPDQDANATAFAIENIKIELERGRLLIVS